MRQASLEFLVNIWKIAESSAFIGGKYREVKFGEVSCDPGGLAYPMEAWGKYHSKRVICSCKDLLLDFT